MHQHVQHNRVFSIFQRDTCNSRDDSKISLAEMIFTHFWLIFVLRKKNLDKILQVIDLWFVLPAPLRSLVVQYISYIDIFWHLKVGANLTSFCLPHSGPIWYSFTSYIDIFRHLKEAHSGCRWYSLFYIDIFWHSKVGDNFKNSYLPHSGCRWVNIFHTLIYFDI